ncbi:MULTISPECIES: DUF4359 domain-containing protein [Flavobacterium]|uniref:DUF4359 domain-containing protein n=1 Tax=Flavobacterium salmonis TaxID=2654844 RepID=A0A6V6Z0W1_9FLAO|nr:MULTISPECIES: DUF4359 domain-containing protein [Flavobacterium]OOV18624.1 hypothetical protein BXU10_02675 [Flavobacterium sp. LM4]CAD0005209.1 hypothetical protein FLAT13_02639 [Flavobacterium salmonis]
MKTKHYVIIGLCLFALIAALSNPGTEKHKEEVKLKMNVFLEKQMNEKNTNQNNEWSKAGNTMGNVFAKSMINMMVDNMVSSSNYVLFSTTNVTFEGKTKTIGIGILGNIFLSGKIDDAMNQEK